MAVNDILRSVIFTRQGNQLGINVRHWIVTAIGGVGLTQAQLAEYFSTQAQSLYPQLLSSSAAVRGASVQKIRPLPVAAVSESNVVNVPGTRTGDPLPRQTSGIITLRTTVAGRGFRGRVYVPFPAEVSNDSAGLPAGTYLVDLATLGTFYSTPQTATVGADSVTMAPIIFRRVLGTFTQVASFVARQAWATQRRRGDFGQGNGN